MLLTTRQHSVLVPLVTATLCTAQMPICKQSCACATKCLPPGRAPTVGAVTALPGHLFSALLIGDQVTAVTMAATSVWGFRPVGGANRPWVSNLLSPLRPSAGQALNKRDLPPGHLALPVSLISKLKRPTNKGQSQQGLRVCALPLVKRCLLLPPPWTNANDGEQEEA